jgi:hypothetical protein
LFFGAGGVLEVGAEVFDEGLFFFGGALVVEGDEFFEELVVGEGLGSAVGVEVVVESCCDDARADELVN